MLKLKNYLYIFGCVIALVACNKQNKNGKEDISEVKTTSISSKTNLPDTLITFKPPISFSDFKTIEKHQEIKAPLQWSSNVNAKQFKTRIIEAYEAKAPNFAGHYIFVDWGCGSPCQSSMLIDWNTGKLFDGINASLGYEYRVDSRMLIVNPPYNKDCIYCEPRIYIFNEQLKRFEEYQIQN